ncbi:MAG TPA: RidA family protein [Nocardioides sp.]|nr:RidA family protein [Nocardioides sp.]
MFPSDVPPPGGPYTPVVVCDGLIFVCGQIGRTPDNELVEDEIKAQARQTFENMSNCLAAAGATLADVMKVNAYLRDWSDFKAFNEVYLEYFAEPYPVRTTVPSPFPLIRLEVECIARVPR